MSATDSERRDYDNYMQDRGYADFREHPFRDRLKMQIARGLPKVSG
jgi:hypothetical protein